jgi:hypothetical protein
MNAVPHWELVFNPDRPDTHLVALEANGAPGFTLETRKCFDMVGLDQRGWESALQ